MSIWVKQSWFSDSLLALGLLRCFHRDALFLVFRKLRQSNRRKTDYRTFWSGLKWKRKTDESVEYDVFSFPLKFSPPGYVYFFRHCFILFLLIQGRFRRFLEGLISVESLFSLWVNLSKKASYVSSFQAASSPGSTTTSTACLNPSSATFRASPSLDYSRWSSPSGNDSVHQNTALCEHVFSLLWPCLAWFRSSTLVPGNICYRRNFPNFDFQSWCSKRLGGMSAEMDRDHGGLILVWNVSVRNSKAGSEFPRKVWSFW